MTEWIILAQSEITERALRQILKLLDPFGSYETGDNKTPAILVDAFGMEADRIFENVAYQLDNLHEGESDLYPFGRRVVLVDQICPDKLDPLGGSTWESAIAMLILAFPEIYWIFGECGGPSIEEFDSATCPWDNSTDYPAFSRHRLPYLFATPQDPLFDGTGLRRFILKKVQEKKEKDQRIAPYIPLRSQLALAMDEETPYAYFNAFAAYRFGFRAFAVRRNQQAKELVGREAPTLRNFKLSFEDIFLNFPDQTDHEHYSDLNNREELLRGLKNPEFRVFVTSEHRHSGDSEKQAQNQKFISSIRGKVVRKPFSGLFNLWEQSELVRKLSWSHPISGKKYRGVAENFFWPPEKQAQTYGEDTGHSAPGRLVQVAEFLIDRAERLLREKIFNVPTCVWGAVLASSAQEILGDRTPTTSITALSLKHNFEVLAECQFSGVEYHISMKSRDDDLKKELKATRWWFGRKQQDQAMENAEMMVLNRVITVLRDYNQYDEERECMNHVRRLHNNLWMRHSKWRYLFKPFLRYGEFLLSSFKGFLAAIVGWVVGMTVLFELGNRFISHNDKNETSFSSFRHSVAFFTGANNIEQTHWVLVALTVLTIAAGLAHLGIFISYMYSLVSRK